MEISYANVAPRFHSALNHRTRIATIASASHRAETSPSHGAQILEANARQLWLQAGLGYGYKLVAADAFLRNREVS